MRSFIVRLTCAAIGIALVASCDTRGPAILGGPQSGGGNQSGNGSGNTTSGTLSLTFQTPTAGALVNVGDSILVTMTLRASAGVKNATAAGYRQTGSADLGTFLQTLRYGPVTIPASGAFPAGVLDTTVKRYLKAVNPTDSTLDSLIIIGTVTDDQGQLDSARLVVHIVAGPHVTITSPVNGDSIPAGVNLSVAANAVQPSGLNQVAIRVQGDATWPTKLDTTITQNYSPAPNSVTLAGAVRIPANAPLHSHVTITATATDVNRLPGSAPPVVISIGTASTTGPLVTQTVGSALELTDSINVAASGQSIVSVGYVARDSVGNVVKRDSVKLSQPYTSNVRMNIPVNLPQTAQGMHLAITAFAWDSVGRIGYAVASSTSIPATSLGVAHTDTAVAVYGHTYALPRSGTIGDMVVDAARGHVFLSNTSNNILEVWQNSSKTFSSTGVPVGSFPWGMFVSNNPDTLLVANSGGTNISRVYIGAADASGMSEDVSHRILTRISSVYTVTENRDVTTGKITLTYAGPFNYSDRPQYIAQTKGGRIFYSTRPTATAPAGTIRWIDPSQTIADAHQVWQYGNVTSGTDFTYAIFNVDGLSVTTFGPNSTLSDVLTVYDHTTGGASSSLVSSNSDPRLAVQADNASGGHAEAVLRLDVSSLGLTDTTFVAESGNRDWVAFGEGHKGVGSRIIMMADSTAGGPNFFSPSINVVDLTNNAAEQVFGVALDSTGSMVGSHGLQSYFAFVDDPFHLRLQGKYDSFDDGAGIAFHPQAKGSAYSSTAACADKTQLAFAGSASGKIQIVDIGHYVSCGTLQLKNTIYGPIRATLPLPGDDPSVIMKLYALTPSGLLVIDLTAADIKLQ